MSFKLSNTYLKLFIMTAAASAMLVGSECLHRLYFDIVPLGRPWEEFLYLLTFTSILCFSRWAFTKVCAAFFLFLCLIVNPVHFEVYQSWINGINYPEFPSRFRFYTESEPLPTSLISVSCS